MALPARLMRPVLAVRRAILLRRRLLAAVCAFLAVLTGLHTLAGPPPPATAVLVATHDLAAGAVLAAADLETRRFAAGTAPAGLVDRAVAVGRTLAAPLTAGEPLTAVRLVGPGLVVGYPGLVALPVRIPDATTVSLLRVGDRIDLLATDPGGAGTQLVASGVPVLALPGPDAETSLTAGAAVSGRLVLVGIPATVTEKVADASVRRFLTVVWTH